MCTWESRLKQSINIDTMISDMSVSDSIAGSATGTSTADEFARLQNRPPGPDDTGAPLTPASSDEF